MWYISSVHPLNNRFWENFREHFLWLLPNSTPQFLFTHLDQVRHYHVVLIDQSAWPSAWWTVQHWWNSKNNGLRTGALFFSSHRLALRARIALRAKDRVRPAWLIKRLSCRLQFRPRIFRFPLDNRYKNGNGNTFFQPVNYSDATVISLHPYSYVLSLFCVFLFIKGCE